MNNENESEDKSDNNIAAVKPMNSIWECKHLCIKTQEDEFGKLVHGWTCAYCPRPGNVGGYVFQKSVNATKRQGMPLCEVKFFHFKIRRLLLIFRRLSLFLVVSASKLTKSQ